MIRPEFADPLAILLVGIALIFSSGTKTYDLSYAEAKANSPPRYESGGVKLASTKGGFEFAYREVDEKILLSPDIKTIEWKNNFAATWTTGACFPEHDFEIASRTAVPSPGKPGYFDVTFIGQCKHTGICLAPPEQWQRDSFALEAIKEIQAGRDDYSLKECKWLRDEVKSRERRRAPSQLSQKTNGDSIYSKTNPAYVAWRELNDRRVAKIERVMVATKSRRKDALRREHVLGRPYSMAGKNFRIPPTISSFALDSFQLFDPCLPTKPRWTGPDSYMVDWECPETVKLPWSAAGTYFKFDGPDIVEVKTGPGTPRIIAVPKK